MLKYTLCKNADDCDYMYYRNLEIGTIVVYFENFESENPRICRLVTVYSKNKNPEEYNKAKNCFRSFTPDPCYYIYFPDKIGVFSGSFCIITDNDEYLVGFQELTRDEYMEEGFADAILEAKPKK